MERLVHISILLITLRKKIDTLINSSFFHFLSYSFWKSNFPVSGCSIFFKTTSIHSSLSDNSRSASSKTKYCTCCNVKPSVPVTCSIRRKGVVIRISTRLFPPIKFRLKNISNILIEWIKLGQKKVDYVPIFISSE